MPASPCVSVIIPTQGRIPLVDLAIGSALNQDVSVEIIVVENGGGNEVRAVLSARRSEVQFLALEAQSAQKARNLGLRVAKGMYVKFLDSDDLLAPHSLKHQVAALERTHADLCFTDWTKRYLDENDNLIGETLQTNDGFDVENPMESLIGKTIGPPLTWLARRDSLENQQWDEQLPCNQDHEFLMQLAASKKHFMYQPGIAGTYFDRKALVSSTGTPANIQCDTRCLLADRYEAMFKRTGRLSEKIANGLAYIHVSSARYYYSRDKKRFRECMARVKQLAPHYRAPGNDWFCTATRFFGLRGAFVIESILRRIVPHKTY